MLLPQDRLYLSELREQTMTILRQAIGEHRDVAIIDAPNQRNVGDSLIWAGEIAYLKRLGVRIRYVADLWTYDPLVLRRLMPTGVVLLHGGGNFGDLWPGHQILREIVARDLQDYRLVQLSQSVHFRDRDRATHANNVLGSHPNFVALLRDDLSLERAAQYLPDVEVMFCPDMALGWDAPVTVDEARSRARKTVLTIARADVEASSGLRDIGDGWVVGADVVSTDWKPRGRHGVSWRVTRAIGLIYRFYVKVRKRWKWLPTFGVDRMGALLLHRLNSVNIAGAVSLYRTADIVVVDRLHAHVLAVLMGKRHIVLDNNYRKVSAIFDKYTGAFSTGTFADSAAQARELVRGSVRSA